MGRLPSRNRERPPTEWRVSLPAAASMSSGRCYATTGAGPGTTGALSSGLTTPNEIPNARVLRVRRPRPAWGTGLGLTAASAGHAGDQLTVVASVVVGLHHWLERCRSLLYVKAARNLETRGLLCACVCRWLAAGRSNSAVRVMCAAERIWRCSLPGAVAGCRWRT